MNANKLVIAAAVSIVLAGCATYSELQQRPADYTAETARSPNDYALCLLPKLLDTNAASHTVSNGVARVIVVPVGGGTPETVMMTFNVTPRDGVTHVEMRHMSSLSKFSKQWAQAQSCI